MNRVASAFLIAAALLIVPFGSAQTPSSGEEQRLLALIKEVQAQQAQMADNQAKIEAKIADLAEAIRVARLYSKREK